MVSKVKANGEVDVHRGLVINSKQAAVERVGGIVIIVLLILLIFIIIIIVIILILVIIIILNDHIPQVVIPENKKQKCTCCVLQ